MAFACRGVPWPALPRPYPPSLQEALRSMREQLKEAGTVPGVKVLLESQGPSPRKTRGRARRESEVATPAKPTPRKRGTPATSARKPRRAKQ